jgi:hypothetical protein
MGNAYENVLGDLNLTKLDGLTEVVVDESEEVVQILLFGTIWITLTPLQAELLRDKLVKPIE